MINMVVLFFSAVIEFLFIPVTCVLLIVYTMKWQQTYWKRKSFPYLKPSLPFGNIGNPMSRKVHLGILVQKMYNDLKQMGVKHGGVYSFLNPVYLPIDPGIIKNVMQKDFYYFQDRGFYHNEKDDPLSAHLFAISGPKWRNLRTKLTPTFSSGKMKMMFETLVQCSDNMLNDMIKYEGKVEGIDIKDALARYTTDVIGSCAFGLECNSFQDENAEFIKHGKIIFKRFSKIRAFVNAFLFSRPSLGRRLRFKIVPKEVSRFFTNVVHETVDYREKNNVKRNDMLQLLIDQRNKSSDDQDCDGLTLNEIAAQAFVFFIAGFETSSTTMAFCLYELAVNQELQQRVRREINSVLSKHNEKITYEVIMDLKYMGQVIEETLRKYPPLAFLTRQCVEDYRIPETDLTIEKDTRLFIPVYALHHDPDYFPNPDKFDPERFSEENRSTIRPFTYIPFGEGPRICIGMRFGLMQTKVGLTVLLKNYLFELNSKTSFPIELNRYNFILTAKGGIWLNVKKV